MCLFVFFPFFSSFFSSLSFNLSFLFFNFSSFLFFSFLSFFFPFLSSFLFSLLLVLFFIIHFFSFFHWSIWYFFLSVRYRSGANNIFFGKIVEWMIECLYDLFCIYKKVKLVTLVEGDTKASFSIATTPSCWRGCYSFALIAPVYPWSVPYNPEC